LRKVGYSPCSSRDDHVEPSIAVRIGVRLSRVLMIRRLRCGRRDALQMWLGTLLMQNIAPGPLEDLPGPGVDLRLTRNGISTSV